MQWERVVVEFELDRDDTNALTWWRGRGAIAVLCPLARMYLAIPASTADVERTWSSAQYLSVSRHRLLPMNLERQMVIRDWILEQMRTHGKRVQGFTAAVESLGQTVMPEEEENEEEEEEVEELVLCNTT